MESNATNSDQQSYGVDQPLAEPRFDEQSTVLSARPVVPLEKVAARARLTRALVVGLTFAGAVVIGMVAASIYYSRVNRDASTPLSATETIPAGVAAGTTEKDRSAASSTESSSSEQARASVNGETPAEERRAVPQYEAPGISTEARKPVARRVDVITSEPRSRGARDRDDRGERDRDDDDRREARREEKQRRREMRRQNRENRTSRDLLRIREIFEGPR